MTAPTDRSRILDRIQKLQALAERGGSVDEGIAATMKVLELMERYSVTQEELQAQAEVEADRPLVTVRAEVPDPVNHNMLLAVLLSSGLKTFKVAFNDNGDKGDAKRTFVYFMAFSTEEAEAARSVWSILVLLRETNLKKDYRAAYKAGRYTQGFKTSFRNGFSTAISDLVSFQESQRTEATSTALVRIEGKLEKAFQAATSTKARPISVRNSENGLGFRKGLERGNEAGSQVINRRKQLPG